MLSEQRVSEHSLDPYGNRAHQASELQRANERLVPEGWYPDPMGFKQLRWWGGDAWTEHVTQPIVVAPSSLIPLAFVPRVIKPVLLPPLPTRREQREQRSRDEQFATLTGPIDLLSELPTELTTVDAGEPATGPNTVSSPTLVTDASAAFTYKPRSLAFSLLHTGIHTRNRPDNRIRALRDPTTDELADEFASDEQEEALYLPRAARSSVSGTEAQLAQLDRTLRTTDPGPRAPSLSTTGLTIGGRQPLPTLAVSHADAVALAAQAYKQSVLLPRASISPVYTWPIWAIALVPVIQLLASLIVLLEFGATPNGWANSVILSSVFFLVIALAIVDRALLKRMGYDKRSTWLWALLGAPVYLVSRSIALFRTGRAGLAPPLVWAFVALLQIGCFVVAPGILIAALPTNFSLQAAKSVTADASILGLTLGVRCPAVPPTMIGERFVCSTTGSTGDRADVTVSLQRQNGWIGWHVDDWGVYKNAK